MSSPKIGEEFERAIYGKKEEETEGLERRLGILSYLSRKPCSTSSEIAKFMKISDRGVLWHLRAMEKAGTIGEVVIDKKTRFFIRGCVREGDCGVFSLIKDRKTRKAVATIFENPGITQKRLSENLQLSRQSTGRILRRLEKAGVITSIRDGKNMRYYPTRKLTELRRIYEERTENASKRIKGLVKDLGMDFDITLDREGLLYMKIAGRDVRFSTDPLRSALED